MDATEAEILQLPKRKIKSIIGDPEKSAKAINLVYVHDNEPGIIRIKKGNSFNYLIEKVKPLKNEADIKRIKSLVIPPAWKNVWICVLANGHLQATGIDVKKRKQ